MRRRGLRSIWKAHYEILDASGQVAYDIREENPWSKILDSILGDIPVIGLFTGFFCHPRYTISRQGQAVMRFTKNRAFLESIGAVSPRQFIPISAIEGVNLAVRSTLGAAKGTTWYKGPTLLEVLDGIPKAPPKVDQPLRMPVQAVYKFTKQGDDRRIVAGRIEAGRAKVGDKVVFTPSNKVSTIKSIEAFNAPSRTEIEAARFAGFGEFQVAGKQPAAPAARAAAVEAR